MFIFTEWIKRKYGSTQEVQIMYNDLPENDFKTLFRRLAGKQVVNSIHLSYN